MVGVQEERSAPKEGEQHDQFKVWSSGSVKGQLGTEIWLHNSLLEYGKNVVAICADPRLIVVRWASSIGNFVIASLHGPTSDKDRALREACWIESAQIISKARKPTDITLILTDANARTGDETSEAIGSFGGEPQNDNGSLFHEFVLKLGLRVPTTWAEHCRPDHHHDTWRHS